MLPRDGSAPGTPGAPKLPLDDDPLLVYSLDVRAADACGGIRENAGKIELHCTVSNRVRVV